MASFSDAVPERLFRAASKECYMDRDQVIASPYRVNGVVVPPATTASIEAFERRFGVALPADYRGFLISHNGGIPSRRRFSVGRTECSIEKFFYLGEMPAMQTREPGQPWEFGNLWAETPVRQQVLGAGCIPIGRNGGDDIVFLDCRKVVPVTCIMFGHTRKTADVARSFTDFLQSLRRRPGQ